MSNQHLIDSAAELKVVFSHYEGQLRSSYAAAISARNGQTGQPLPMSLADVNWFEVFTKFVASTWQVLSKKPITKDELRAAVIEASVVFFREAVDPILAEAFDRPLIYNAIVSPAVEKAIPLIVGGIVDGAYKVLAARSAQQTSDEFTPY